MLKGKEFNKPRSQCVLEARQALPSVSIERELPVNEDVSDRTWLEMGDLVEMLT